MQDNLNINITRKSKKKKKMVQLQVIITSYHGNRINQSLFLGFLKGSYSREKCLFIVRLC
jgi:hypothetical protein